MRHPQKVIDRAAYQIWGLIQRTGGDCTVHDMAKVTGLSHQACSRIAGLKGWGCDYRKVSSRGANSPYLGGGRPQSYLNGALSNLEQWA